MGDAPLALTSIHILLYLKKKKHRLIEKLVLCVCFCERCAQDVIAKAICVAPY